LLRETPICNRRPRWFLPPAITEAFDGLLISEVASVKFATTPSTPQATLENTVAVLDRKCTENRSRSAHAVAATEVQDQMRRRATTIMKSMQAILRNLNDAKGYK
jgi:hypothetical protein